jgi:hypothetical protein
VESITAEASHQQVMMCNGSIQKFYLCYHSRLQECTDTLLPCILLGMLSSPLLLLPQVLKRLPNLKKLDGVPVDVDERDQALQARGPAAAAS